MEQWQAYRDNKLIAPAIVQHDETTDGHLIWVWMGAKGIIGPLSRTEYDETKILAELIVIANSLDAATETPENKEAEALKTTIANLTTENATLKAANTTLTAEKIALEKQIATAKTIEAVR